MSLIDKRYRRGRWLARLVALTPPLIFLICVGVYLVSVGKLLRKHLPQLIASGAGIALHREITIGGVTASRSFDTIVFHDVAVSDAPTFALGHGRAVVAAPRVTVNLDAAGLLHDASNAGAYIHVITVDHPVGYVARRRGNKFNFSDLFKKTKSKKQSKPFGAVIRVVAGTVTFQDALAPADYQPAINRLSDVNGNLSFATPHEITFDVAARAAPNRFQAAHVTGAIAFDPVKNQVDDRVGGYDIQIDGQHANAPYFVGYFLEKALKPIGRIRQGVGNVSLTLSQRDPGPKVPLDIAGFAQVSGGQLLVANRAILREPVDNVRGLVRFTGNSLWLDATGDAAGMPIHAVGSVPSFKHPTLAFRATAPRVIAARLHGLLPFVPAQPAWLQNALPGSAVAVATGPVTLARFDVTYSDPSASVYGVTLHAIHCGLTFEGKSLTLRSLIASTRGQTDNIAAAGAFVTTPHGAARLVGHATDIDLATTQLPGDLRHTLGGLTGIADADVQFASSGLAGNAYASPLSVTARLRDGSIHGIPIEQAAAQVTASGASARIKSLIAVQPNGATFSLSGTAPIAPLSKAPLHLDVAASGADLGQIAAQFGMKKISGLGYFRGHLDSTFGAPRITGQASVFNAAYGSVVVDHARADIAFSPSNFSVTSGSVQRLGINARFKGLVTGLNTRHPRILASATTRDAEIAALTLLSTESMSAPGAPKLSPALRAAAANATGTLDASVTVSGPLSSPAVSARATVASAVVNSLRIARLTAQASYDAGMLRVPELTSQIDGVNIAGSGAVNFKSKALHADVQANSADLSQLSAATGLGDTVTGSASARAIVGGTLNDPDALVTGTLTDSKYKDVQLNTSQIALRYAGGRLQSIAGEPLIVQSGPATYTLRSFDYDTRSKAANLDAAVSGEQIARLVALAKTLAPGNSQAAATLALLPPGLAGALEVTSFQLSGPVSKPNARIAVAIRDLTLGQPGEDKLSVTADGSYSGGTATLTTLEARGPVEYLSASGSFTPNGRLNAQVDASDFPLSFLHEVNPALPKLGGALSDLTAIASGTANQPVVNASVSLTDVTSGAVSIDRIDSGRITAANNRIDIAGLSLVKLEPPMPGSSVGAAAVQHTALLQGYLPFQFSLAGGMTASFPADGQVSLTASLPTQSVSLLSLFNPSLKTLKLTGTVGGNVEVAGTLSHKTIQGTLNLANASFQPAGFRTSLQNINLAAVFNGEHGTISSSQIKSSAGGYVTLGGTVDVAQTSDQASYPSAAEALLGSLRLNLTAAATNFTIDEPKIATLYDAGAEGVINGQAKAAGPLLTPLVTGSFQVTKAVGILPTVQPKVSGPQPVPAFNPSFNLTVAIAPGAQVRSSQLNAKLDGRVQITRSLYQPDVEGDFNVRSGILNFYTARFRVVPTGSVHVSYNPPADPVERVQMTATTSLSISPALLAANPIGASTLTSGEPYNYNAGSVFSPVQDNRPQRYAITVMIDGDLGQPNGLHLTFDSDPPGLTDEQILAALGGQQVLSSLLVGGNVQYALQSEAQQVFTGYALPTLLAPFENSVAQAFGLEEIDVDYEPQSTTAITLYKNLTPRLEIRYTRFVNSRQATGAVGSTLTPLEYSVAVDYYFTNKFRFDVSTDDQHNTTFALGGAVNF